MIQLKIHSESDLYNSLDPSRTRLDDDVYKYLKSFCTEMEFNKHLHDTLQIISDEPVDAERAKQSIVKAVKKDRDEFDRQIALNRKRALGGYVIGISLSIAGFALALILNQILLQLISFFGSMAVRDAVVIQTKINPDLRRLKQLLEPFYDFKVEVVETGS